MEREEIDANTPLLGKDYRRNIVGERLVHRAIRWFKAKGLSSVEMRVSTANPVATAFWRKMGFEPYMTVNKKKV